MLNTGYDMVRQTDASRVPGAPRPTGRGSPARIWGAQFYRLSGYFATLQGATG